MITVATVLKTGEFHNRNQKLAYEPKHVYWLQEQIARHLHCQHRFVCFSNEKLNCTTIPLQHNWPGWWSKLEMFRPVEGVDRVFYFDLDTVVVGDITHIVKHKHKFSVLRNLSKVGRIGSGLMAWRGDQSHLYSVFAKNPELYMQRYVTAERWGDQGFIQDHIEKWDYLQQKFAGQIIGYKFDLDDTYTLPEAARIVVFNGRPKPWQVTHDWIPGCA